MFKICVDTGGTFTEAVVLDDKGRFAEYKTPTTPSDFSQGAWSMFALLTFSCVMLPIVLKAAL
jgi:N-methylhydantoinase A/oxoprolinase/acetone carboxylase beta subunit